MPLTAGTRIGPYEIIGPLGVGGMGEVYRARDAKLNRDVAIKVLPELFSRDPERLARFEREAQALAALNHPNIAQIYGVVDTELVMELVEGEDLAQRIARSAIPIEDALPIAKQVAEALEAAHERGIIHRDLKPANIKVTPEGVVKILDFGLAKAMDGRPDETAAAFSPASPTLTSPPMITTVGSIVGTAAYMSPEQAKGRPADKRSDVWAFGCVLFEMLSGRRPFGGDTIAEMFASVLKSDVPWAGLPAATPPRIRELLRRCLEKDPRRRLQAIGEARVQLDEMIAGAGIAEALPPSAPPVRRGGPLRILAIVAAVSAFPLAVGIVVLLSRVASHQDPVARPVHFTVPYEEPFAGMAVSPDGTQMAFGAKQPGAGTALWLRRFDAAEAEVLPGTTGAAWPFWSPDSRSIGFFAAGRLKRFDVAARSVQVVCSVDTGLGAAAYRAAWAADDTILFLVSNGTMFRVPAAGGTPRQVIVDNEPPASGRFTALQVLPDSRRFLVHTFRGDPGTFLGSLDKPGLTRISDARVTFLLPDTFLAQREDSVSTQRVDPASLAPVGPARSVQLTAVGGLSVSQTGVLVYRSTLGTATDLTWMDRSGRPQGTIGGVGDYYMPRISRDGTRVAFEAHNPANTGDLHVFDVARGQTSRITFDPTHHNAGAVWSPSGDRLLFHSTRQGQSLYLKPTSGLGAEQLFLKSDSANPTDWSPDGQVALVDMRRDAYSGIYAIAIDGDRRPEPALVVPGSSTMQGQFSPDGKWIAYTSNESGEFEIYLSPYPATGAKWQVSNAGGDSPRWDWDGRALFYVSRDQEVMAASIALAPRVETGKPERLFQAAIRPRGTSDFYQYDVVPDGQRFLLVTLRAATAPLHVVVNWPALVRER